MGFFLGFLIGAGVGAVLSREEASEVPQPSGDADAKGPLKDLREKALSQIQLAREAARLESEAKKEELMREFEKVTRHSDDEKRSPKSS